MDTPFLFLDDNDFGVIDTKKLPNIISKKEPIPQKIEGYYSDDYDITYIDNIIKRLLESEKKDKLPQLRAKERSMIFSLEKPQIHISRLSTERSLSALREQIKGIETGSKLVTYIERTKEILLKYKSLKKEGSIRIVTLDNEENNSYMDDATIRRISLIEDFISIASEYISINLVRRRERREECCIGCGTPLSKALETVDGSQICTVCQTEQNSMIMRRSAKDNLRVNFVSNEDESIENFLKAFYRYQGLQQETLPESLLDDLDEYFVKHGRPTGKEIREMELNSRGRRGDTNHSMLWGALSATGNSRYYEDANLIGHIYWGWKLHDLMHLKETLISHYMKTQSVFYQIDPIERERESSLGTQFRLWKQLQLVGHDCHMDEFKIAENPESLRIHNKLWRLMCEGANDPDIYFID